MRLAKVSRARRPSSERVEPEILRLMTYSRMSRSLRLLCRGMFVLVPSFEGLVERLEIGFGFTQRIEACLDRAFGFGVGFELVGLELVVEAPKGFASAV